jgi:hypothetical protein
MHCAGNQHHRRAEKCEPGLRQAANDPSHDKATKYVNAIELMSSAHQAENSGVIETRKTNVTQIRALASHRQPKPHVPVHSRQCVWQ